MALPGLPCGDAPLALQSMDLGRRAPDLRLQCGLGAAPPLPTPSPCLHGRRPGLDFGPGEQRGAGAPPAQLCGNFFPAALGPQRSAKGAALPAEAGVCLPSPATAPDLRHLPEESPL
ncbi:hypothetical protein P7K49_005346, partial [Saguinus oedipus]